MVRAKYVQWLVEMKLLEMAELRALEPLEIMELLDERPAHVQQRHWIHLMDQLCRSQFVYYHRAQPNYMNLRYFMKWAIVSVTISVYATQHSWKIPLTTSPLRDSWWFLWSPVKASWTLYANEYCGNGSYSVLAGARAKAGPNAGVFNSLGGSRILHVLNSIKYTNAMKETYVYEYKKIEPRKSIENACI